MAATPPAGDLAAAFEALLRRHGLQVRTGSQLEHVILDVFALEYGLNPHQLDPGPFARSLAGFSDLARLVLSVHAHPSFASILPHLRLLNDGSVLQNTASAATDDIANKLFELYVACLAMRCGTRVSMDHPEKSDGRNPDVLADFDGTRWGLACKVLHGTHPQSILNLIESGLGQIDRSEASTGIVMINLKNRIDHAFYWPPLTMDSAGQPASHAFENTDQPLQGLVHDVQQIGATLLTHAPLSTIGEMFTGRKSLPAFVFWAQTTALIVKPQRTFINSVHVLNIQAWKNLSPQQRRPLECFDSVLGEN